MQRQDHFGIRLNEFSDMINYVKSFHGAFGILYLNADFFKNFVYKTLERGSMVEAYQTKIKLAAPMSAFNELILKILELKLDDVVNLTARFLDQYPKLVVALNQHKSYNGLINSIISWHMKDANIKKCFGKRLEIAKRFFAGENPVELPLPSGFYKMTDNFKRGGLIINENIKIEAINFLYSNIDFFYAPFHDSSFQSWMLQSAGWKQNITRLFTKIVIETFLLEEDFFGSKHNNQAMPIANVRLMLYKDALQALLEYSDSNLLDTLLDERNEIALGIIYYSKDKDMLACIEDWYKDHPDMSRKRDSRANLLFKRNPSVEMMKYRFITLFNTSPELPATNNTSPSHVSQNRPM